jgi:hypothetical protein
MKTTFREKKKKEPKKYKKEHNGKKTKINLNYKHEGP